MKENTQDKNLITFNKKNLFYRIKNLFIYLFHKKNNTTITTTVIKNRNTTNTAHTDKDSFIKRIRNIENEETKLLKLQKLYRTGKIKEEELTQYQINSLCSLYDKQIEKLKKSNEYKRQKLLEYKKI